MTDKDRAHLLRDLSNLATLVEQDQVTGFVIAAVFPNETSQTVQVVPAQQYTDRLIQVLDRLLFQLKITCYLSSQARTSPENGGGH